MNTLANKLVSLTNPSSFAAEQYQNLRLKIERLRQTRDLRVIAVTSPGASDGKTVKARMTDDARFTATGMTWRIGGQECHRWLRRGRSMIALPILRQQHKDNNTRVTTQE